MENLDWKHILGVWCFLFWSCCFSRHINVYELSHLFSTFEIQSLPAIFCNPLSCAELPVRRSRVLSISSPPCGLFLVAGWSMAGTCCRCCKARWCARSMSSCSITVAFTYTLCGGTRRTVSTQLLSKELYSVYRKPHCSNTFWVFFFLGLYLSK